MTDSTAANEGLPATLPGLAIEQELAIDLRSIDFIPPAERHGTVWRQGPFWFLSNFTFFTVAVGFLGPTAGLSIAWTTVAGLIGVAVGTVFMALHATQGPRLGLPQLIQSRAQFGYRGVLVPLVGAMVTYIGYNVIDILLVPDGLHSIYGWNRLFVAIAMVVIGTVLAIWGYDWIHRFFRWLLYISLPFYIAISVGILAGVIHHSGHVTPGGFSAAGFSVVVVAAASYNVTYAFFVSDYTRYLPENSSKRKLILWVYFGASVPVVWLIAMGAWLASRLGATDALSGLRSAGNSTVPEIGTIVSILTVLALVGTIGENGYSGALSLMTLVDSVKSIRPSVNWRIVGSLFMAVVSLAFGLWLLFSNKYLSALDDMLTIVLYLAAPWTAINLLDFFYIRRGRYAVTDLFDRRGIYGSWGTRALVSYFVALAAEVPFMLLSFYTGPAASAIGDVDISFAVGLVVSGALYLILTRGHNMTLEESAIEVSRTRLESASADRERGLSVAPRLG